jgi:hypothetical protein
MCRDAGYREGVIWSIETLAGAAFAAGDLQRASTLLGAASTMRDLAGIPVWHMDEGTMLKNLVQSVKAQDPQGYQTAWARGTAMSLDQAVAYASG